MAEPCPSPHRHGVRGLRDHQKPAPLIWSRIEELFLPYAESRMNLHDPVSRWGIANQDTPSGMVTGSPGQEKYQSGWPRLLSVLRLPSQYTA